jgi:hypothetical protein
MAKHDMLYLASNSDVPRGIVTSTARKGRKWFHQAKVSDTLVLRVTEGNRRFGEAVAVKVELVTLAVVVARAAENHTGQRSLPVPGYSPSEVLQMELAAAYGMDGQNAPYTMVHFVVRTDAEVEDALLSAAKSLIDDVRSRHPGEELRCPYMRALDGAVSAAV